MRRMAPSVMALLLVVTISGCGTMLNVSGTERLELDVRNSDGAAVNPPPPFEPKYERPPFPFGGFANNVAWIRSADEPIEIIFTLMDMPFSLAADVITLPWTAFEFTRERLHPTAKYDTRKRRLNEKESDDAGRNFWLETSPKSAPEEMGK